VKTLSLPERGDDKNSENNSHESFRSGFFFIVMDKKMTVRYCKEFFLVVSLKILKNNVFIIIDEMGFYNPPSYKTGKK
jgi:hypothetical protein